MSATRSVRVERAASRADEVHYEVDATALRDATFAADGDASVFADADGASVVAPADSGAVRLRVSWADGSALRFLPGPTLLADVEAAVDGDHAAAERVRDRFVTPFRVAAVCGAFLAPTALVDLLGAVAATGDRAESALHSFRYDVVRAALASFDGLAVRDAAELRALVDGLHALDGVGDVDLPDAIAETAYRRHDDPGDLVALLDRLGLDAPALERRDDHRFLAYRLAHLVTTTGVDAAQSYARQRRYRVDGDYDERKQTARDAAYDARGRAWRNLLCAAARRDQHEFAFVLANAAYWTGEVSRTDARADELCFDAAATLADAVGLDYVAGHARHARLVAAGHRRRSRKHHASAVAAFDAAERVARAHDFLPVWESVYARAVVRANQLSAAGRHDDCTAAVDDAIGELGALDDAPADRREHAEHHLRALDHENAARAARDRGEDETARVLLESARDHYAAIDFERSRARVAAKLDALADGEDASEFDRAAGGPRGAAARPLVERRDPDYPDLNDALTDYDPGAVGSDDVMVIPERDDDPLLDDPTGSARDDWR